MKGDGNTARLRCSSTNSVRARSDPPDLADLARSRAARRQPRRPAVRADRQARGGERPATAKELDASTVGAELLQRVTDILSRGRPLRHPWYCAASLREFVPPRCSGTHESPLRDGLWRVVRRRPPRGVSPIVSLPLHLCRHCLRRCSVGSAWRASRLRLLYAPL